MSAENRVIIKADPKPNTPAGWLARLKAVTTAAGTVATTTFAPIATLLTQLTTDTALFDTLQSKAANKGKAEVSARNAQWRVSQKSYRAFSAGVQGLCDAAPDAAAAQAIAKAASLETKLPAVRIMPALRGKALGNGAVRLYGRRPVPRRAGAFFEWAASLDGGRTWATFATTNTAKAQDSGLAVGTTVAFRYRTTFKNVTSEWGQMIAILVS